MTDVLASPYPTNPVDYLSRIAELFAGYKQRALDFLDCSAGEHLVDVGCGPGDDLLVLAKAFPEQLTLTGIELDTASLNSARARAKAAGVRINFLQGQIRSLPLPDESADVTHCDRMFQHLENPDAALKEMIRVIKPGGRVLVVDVDWGSLILDHPSADRTDELVDFIRDSHVNGRAGRKLRGAFQRAGLKDIQAYADSVSINNWNVAKTIWGLEDAVNRMVSDRIWTQHQAEHWLHEGDLHAEKNEFSAAMTGFVVRGRKAG